MFLSHVIIFPCAKHNIVIVLGRIWNIWPLFEKKILINTVFIYAFFASTREYNRYTTLYLLPFWLIRLEFPHNFNYESYRVHTLLLYEFVYICLNLNGYISTLCFKSLAKKSNSWLNFYEVELLLIVCMYGSAKDFLL